MIALIGILLLVLITSVQGAAMPGAALWLPDDGTKLPDSLGAEADKRLARSVETLSDLIGDVGPNADLSPTLFVDLKSCLAISNEPDLDKKCFDALDRLNRWERTLETAHAQLLRAQSAAKDQDAFDKQLMPKAEQTYNALKAQLRLSEALAMALVARRMAIWNNKSYAIQAMESAIDSLQLAIKCAEKSSPKLHGEPVITPAFLTSARSRFLSEWDKAQREDSLEPMRGFNLVSQVRAALRSKPDPSAVKGLAWLVSN